MILRNLFPFKRNLFPFLKILVLILLINRDVFKYFSLHRYLLFRKIEIIINLNLINPLLRFVYYKALLNQRHIFIFYWMNLNLRIYWLLMVHFLIHKIYLIIIFHCF